MPCELRFGLLGTPVLFDDIGHDDAVHPIGSPKLRALLAALLLEPGRVVSVDALKDALWGGSPPASAHASLHNHVTRLRRLLDDPERLRAVPPGYLLRVGEGELDVHVFETHVAAARTAHADRDWPRTVHECTAALDLWRGTPLSGLPAEFGGYAFAQRLAEARLLVLEWRYDAELALGGVRLGGLVPELAELVADHPLREGYHRQLMLALHRTGRQAEALAVHRDLRSRLIEELGIEPGAGVRGAHVEVLRGAAAREGHGEFARGESRGGRGGPRGLAAPEARGGVPRGEAVRETYGEVAQGAAASEVWGEAAWGTAAGEARAEVAQGLAARAVRGPGPQEAASEVRGGVPRGEAAPEMRGEVTQGAAAREARAEVAQGLAARAVRGPGPQEAASEVRGGVPRGEAVRETYGEPAQGAAAREARVEVARRAAPEAYVAMPQGTEVREAWDLPRGAAAAREAATEREAATDPGAATDRVADTSHIGDSSRIGDTGHAGHAGDAGHVGAPGHVGAAEVTGADEPVDAADAAEPVDASDARELVDASDAAEPVNAVGAREPVDASGAVEPVDGVGAADPDRREQPVAPSPRPAQLPPPPAHFTGRADTLRALRDTLAAHSTEPRAHPLAVISGMAGVGKSALALHTAHELRDRFPDGQLYVNLHGATPGMTPLTSGQALHALLRDLGAEPRHIPEHPDAAAALLRSLLAPTRTLMVLDDAENAAQVRPLLPAGTGCAVIVTSRSPLTALDGAHRFPLAPLSGEDSAALLRAVSGRDGLDAAHPLVELAGRLPLALRVVAARLAARRALTPDVLAGQLAATEGRLHHLEYDDLSVRRSLAVAHDALAAADRETDRDAALALRHIGALDLPAYGAPLFARLAGTGERRAEAALDRLVDVALLEETAYGRYAPHDLVRDFARELAEAEPVGESVDTALGWYAAVAEHTVTAIVEPGPDQDDRRHPTAAQLPGHAPEVAATAPFLTPEDAFAWGDLELENVVTLVTRYEDEDGSTADHRRTAHISTLVRLLFPYVLRSGRVAEMEVLGRAALGAARRLGDAAAEAYALGDLAGLHFLTGRQSEALGLNDRALAIWWRLDAVSWIRRCLNNRGLLLEGLGRYAESGVALRQSLAYSRQLGDPHGEAVTYSHLGNLYEHTDPRAAIEQHRRSLAIGEEIGAVIVQHSAHCNIGYAHLTFGEPAAAVPHFEESLRVLGGHGDWHGESQTRLGLVRALRLLGRTERAGTECAELLRRADARADRYMGGLARHQQGLLLHEQGHAEEAYQEWRAALEALDGTDEKVVVQELGVLLSQHDAR
nr:tetratricopeptide repeat protein [Streptomyces sp. NBC_00886]